MRLGGGLCRVVASGVKRQTVRNSALPPQNDRILTPDDGIWDCEVEITNVAFISLPFSASTIQPVLEHVDA